MRDKLSRSLSLSRPKTIGLACFAAAVTAGTLIACGGGGGVADEVLARMAEYPAEWNVAFAPAAAVPENYEGARKTTTLLKGTVYPPAPSLHVPFGASAPATKPLPCDIVWEQNIPVKLRDGVTIYTDMLRPATQSTNLPAVIAWSPYGKAIPTYPTPTVPPEWTTGLQKAEAADAGTYACAGYALVNPDVRGSYNSEGKLVFWGSVDANDGYDVVEWVASQSWSSGKVAFYGASWLAISQWFIAATQPPHLTAIIPWNGFLDTYREFVAFGGIPDLNFVGPVEAGLSGRGVSERLSTMIKQYPLMNAYWDDKSAYSKLGQIKVPAFVVADGVTSFHPTGTLQAFRLLGSKDKWLRINNSNEWHDQYKPEHQQEQIRFLDKYLKGIDNGWEKTPRVRVDVINAGGTDREGVPFTDWPIPQTQYTKLYLDASTEALGTTPPSKEAAARYDAQTGQTTFTYTFAQDTQLIGYMKLHLAVEAEQADDMDLFTLVEKLDANDNVLVPHEEMGAGYFPMVPPPGAPGRQRVSLRELDPALSTDFFPVPSFRNSQKLAAGQVVTVDIPVQPRAYLFKAGQKLRLTIAGNSDSAKYSFANTLAPTINKGTHVIHTGVAAGSFLQIPVVPIQ
ncbi:MAG: CocE/NonD family hydrolase [Pigmentiphaga sp.]|uniref:CocE/NonD family hydrolase n=1 Tax=Pigmentiphaga sp. TaxID=1977564 RepID=UPI003B550A75